MSTARVDIDEAWMTVVLHFKDRANKAERRSKGLENDYDMTRAALHAVRELVSEGLNINCAFVDDDARFLVTLARRAVLAGLAEDIDPATLKTIKEHVREKPGNE